MQILKVHNGETGSSSTCGLEQTCQKSETRGKTSDSFGIEVESHVEDEIDCVQQHKHGKQPPSCVPGKQEGKTATGMVQKELELLPQWAPLCATLGRGPNGQPQHTRKACIANDDQKSHQKERKNCALKGDHRIVRKGEAEIIESGGAGKETPPYSAL